MKNILRVITYSILIILILLFVYNEYYIRNEASGTPEISQNECEKECKEYTLENFKNNSSLEITALPDLLKPLCKTNETILLDNGNVLIFDVYNIQQYNAETQDFFLINRINATTGLKNEPEYSFLTKPVILPDGNVFYRGYIVNPVTNKLDNSKNKYAEVLVKLEKTLNQEGAEQKGNFIVKDIYEDGIIVYGKNCKTNVCNEVLLYDPFKPDKYKPAKLENETASFFSTRLPDNRLLISSYDGNKLILNIYDALQGKLGKPLKISFGEYVIKFVDSYFDQLRNMSNLYVLSTNQVLHLSAGYDENSDDLFSHLINLDNGKVTVSKAGKHFTNYVQAFKLRDRKVLLFNYDNSLLFLIDPYSGQINTKNITKKDFIDNKVDRLWFEGIKGTQLKDGSILFTGGFPDHPKYGIHPYCGNTCSKTAFLLKLKNN
jgi:hypothetical protein